MFLSMSPSGGRPSAPPPLGAGLDAPDVEPTAEPRVSRARASLSLYAWSSGLCAGSQSQQVLLEPLGSLGPTPEAVGGCVAWEGRMLRPG